VSVDAILQVLKQNAELARRTVARLAASLPDAAESPAHGATKHAILTTRAELPPAVRERLSWLLG
jgi:hypothetical protein